MAFKRVLNSMWFIKVIFFSGLTIIAIVSLLAYLHITNLSKATDMVVHTYKVNVELEQILSQLKDAETGQRGFLITKDSLFLQPYMSGRENINNSFATLKFLTEDEPEQQENLKELGVLINDLLKDLDRVNYVVLNNLSSRNEFNIFFKESKDKMDLARSRIQKMIALQSELMEERKALYESRVELTPIFLLGFMLITLILIFAAYLRITDNLKRLQRNNRALELFKETTKQSEIINNHGSWVWHIDKNRFTFSDNLYRLLGEKPRSFPSTIEAFSEFIHPEDKEKVAKQTEKMMEEKDLPFIYYRVMHKNGNVRHLKAYGKSLRTREGSLQLLGTTTDITDEIDNFRQLEEQNAELVRNNKELAAFNYVASHDLQEPLRKIQTFLSRLEEKESTNLSQKGLTYIGRIKNAASRMRSLIDDLLQYSRTNKSERVLEMSNINLILENARQDLSDAIVTSNAVIEADTFPVMNVIPFQMQQLFANLLNNSLKYRSEDRDPHIKITYENVLAINEEKLDNTSKEAYHKIIFKDNGIGFEQEYADRIFVLFNRLHGKGEYSGTGIGLSICKKIVENHKGYIFAEGVPDEGATFFVYIPVTS